MVNAQVLPFACRAETCDMLDGDAPVVYCTRQRWHAGDHRAHLEGRMIEWSDPPAEPDQEDIMQPLPPPPLSWQRIPGQLGDTDDGTWSDELEVTSEHTWPVVEALLWLLFVVAVACAPAVVVALWRLAL